jgi:hypothetical protein
MHMETYGKHPDMRAAGAEDRFLSMLFRPSAAYGRPSDILADDDLTIYEKKAILASWASDAWALESAPALRAPSELAEPASIDDIMQCLKVLDEEIQKRCLIWEKSS